MPKMLPPTLLASLTAVGGTPTLTPTGALSPMDPIKSLAQSMPPARPPMPTQPAIMRQQPQYQQPIISNMMSSAAPPSIIPMTQQAPLIPGMMPAAQPLIGATAIPYIPATQIGGSIDLLGNKIVSPVDLVGGAGALPAPPTPPSGTPSRSMSLTDKAPSIESPAASGQLEWAIKSQSKLKYTQLFNTTDRTRSGFLTGAQARNLMVQTKLPQAVLAQIWALSDMDSDGRLGCEEFVLAMYLCELAAQGDVIPVKLPLDLIPPSFRKGLSRHGSAAGSRHGSVSSQSGGGGAAAALVDAGGTDATAGLPNQCKNFRIFFLIFKIIPIICSFV